MSSNPPAYSRQTIALALLCGALPGLFLLITSTTFLVEGQFVYDVKRLLQLGIITALFLAATFNPSLRNAFGAQLARIPKWVKTLLLLIVALGITSSAVNATSNMHLAYSLLEVALLSMLVLAALVIAACRVVAGELFDQVAITLLAMTSIVVGMQELLGVAAALANDTEYYFRISLMHYSWPRFFNQVQAWTLPVLAALPMVWSGSKSELLRSKVFQAVVCLVALSFNWYIILMTGGRGVALSLFAAFAVCLMFFPAIRKTCIRWHLPGLILGVVLYSVIGAIQTQEPNPETSQEFSTPAENQLANPDDWFDADEGESRFSRQSLVGRLSLDSSGRVYMWRLAWGQMKASPLLGIGPIQYACTGEERLAAHPHSFVMQFSAEWGLLAAALLAMVVAFVVASVLKSRHEFVQSTESQVAAGLLIAGVLAAGLYSFLSGVFIMPASQTVAVLTAGWAIDALRGNASSSAPTSTLLRLTLPLACLISLMVLTLAAIEFENLEANAQLISSGDSKFPRFWQEGKACKYFDHEVR